MMKRLFLFTMISLSIVFSSCDDNDSFSADRSSALSFSADTISFDTIFSTIPSSTRIFYAYNNNGDGIRIGNVRLQRGNQTGFRVNVDGTYLDNSLGSQASDFEIRKGDSIRVFVEITSATNNANEPILVEDNLIFSLESGVEQKVNLRVWSWDAIIHDSLIIKSDTVISSEQPIYIRSGIRVDSAATLEIYPPTSLYFREKAGISVYGRIVIEGTPGHDVVLRGSRTDRMFDYLPYDRVSGQWKGIHIYPSSTGNMITYADIHSAEDGIVCDSIAYTKAEVRLALNHTTIHNCKGYGLKAYNSFISVANSQISNTLGDCMAVIGGRAEVIHTTLAQFYPFSAGRGAALRFANYEGEHSYPLEGFVCYNSLVTGYADDVIMGDSKDSTVAFGYYFDNCILRTPAPDSISAENPPFVNTTFELPDYSGEDHFKDVDIDLQYYDFHLDSLSTARRKAPTLQQFLYDRDGVLRPDSADIGCYQYQ